MKLHEKTVISLRRGECTFNCWCIAGGSLRITLDCDPSQHSSFPYLVHIASSPEWQWTFCWGDAVLSSLLACLRVISSVKNGVGGQNMHLSKRVSWKGGQSKLYFGKGGQCLRKYPLVKMGLLERWQGYEKLKLAQHKLASLSSYIPGEAEICHKK